MIKNTEGGNEGGKEAPCGNECSTELDRLSDMKGEVPPFIHKIISILHQSCNVSATLLVNSKCPCKKASQSGRSSHLGSTQLNINLSDLNEGEPASSFDLTALKK